MCLAALAFHRRIGDVTGQLFGGLEPLDHLPGREPFRDGYLVRHQLAALDLAQHLKQRRAGGEGIFSRFRLNVEDAPDTGNAEHGQRLGVDDAFLLQRLRNLLAGAALRNVDDLVFCSGPSAVAITQPAAPIPPATTASSTRVASSRAAIDMAERRGFRRLASGLGRLMREF
jgi:hypothetical protein